jgi:hypothetical protein
MIWMPLPPVFDKIDANGEKYPYNARLQTTRSNFIEYLEKRNDAIDWCDRNKIEYLDRHGRFYFTDEKTLFLFLLSVQ